MTNWCGCLSCSGECPAGTYLASACTAKADRVCLPAKADASVPVSTPDAAADATIGPTNVTELDGGIDGGIDAEVVVVTVDAGVDGTPVIITTPDASPDAVLQNPDLGLDVAPVLGPDAAIDTSPIIVKPGVDAGADAVVVVPTVDASAVVTEAGRVTVDTGVAVVDGAVASVDGGAKPAVDTGVGSDAAKPKPATDSSSGCSCNMGGHSSQSALGGIFVALGMLVTAVRRRKRA